MKSPKASCQAWITSGFKGSPAPAQCRRRGNRQRARSCFTSSRYSVGGAQKTETSWRAGRHAGRRGAVDGRLEIVPARWRPTQRDADRDARNLGERLLDLGNLLDRGDDCPRAAVARPVSDVLGTERRRAGDDERTQLEA